MENVIEKAARVIHAGHCCPCDLRGCCEPDPVDYNAARALAEAGLLAPSPLREEWAARYVNGGGAICRTRDEAEAELDRMTRNSRIRIEEPPAPEIAGIYARYVTAWEHAEL